MFIPQTTELSYKDLTYKQQINHPKWQRRRLEVMERDGFQCQVCFDRNKKQNVHHKYYIYNKLIWEYPDELLLTVCEDCHKKIHTFIEKDITLTKIVEYLMINKTDFIIIMERIKELYNQQPYNFEKTLNRLILSQTIQEDEI